MLLHSQRQIEHVDGFFEHRDGNYRFLRVQRVIMCLETVEEGHFTLHKDLYDLVDQLLFSCFLQGVCSALAVTLLFVAAVELTPELGHLIFEHVVFLLFAFLIINFFTHVLNNGFARFD